VYRPGSGVAEDIPRLPSLAEHVRQAMGHEEARDGAPDPDVGAAGEGCGAIERGDDRLGDCLDESAPALPLPLAVGTAPIAPQVAGFFAQLRYLGQLDLTYLACEGDGELVLVDQHAAHERVELARLRERHARGGDAHVAVQNMLFPVTLDVTPAQLALVARLGELLAQVGFEVEPFGKATLAVKAVPASIRHGDPAQLLRRLLHDWAEAGAPSEAERLDALLGTIACHSVVRAGDRLAAGEVDTLLRSLDGIDLSLPAPHGRAVLLRLPLSEIGRRFGRS
jgi:DNA mismatch repair protein MutL